MGQPTVILGLMHNDRSHQIPGHLLISRQRKLTPEGNSLAQTGRPLLETGSPSWGHRGDRPGQPAG